MFKDLLKFPTAEDLAMAGPSFLFIRLKSQTFKGQQLLLAASTPFISTKDLKGKGERSGRIVIASKLVIQKRHRHA